MSIVVSGVEIMKAFGSFRLCGLVSRLGPAGTELDSIYRLYYFFLKKVAVELLLTEGIADHLQAKSEDDLAGVIQVNNNCLFWNNMWCC